MTQVAGIKSPVAKVATFLDLIKFAHSVFALPFALVATFMASHAIGLSWPGWKRLGLILVCMVAARTYAMTVNRLVDRKFDALNPRAAKRPSVTGVVSPALMVLAISISAAVFVAATYLFYLAFENWWPAALSAPVLLWLGFYSYTKRFTWLCHIVLGMSLGLAPVCAWIAIAPPAAPAMTMPILLLGLAVVCWVAGFDILYALQDEEVDRKYRLYSIPARFGRRNALMISRMLHLATILLLAGVGDSGHFGVLYWIGFAAAAILLIVEQSLVKVNDISKINIAFMTVNGTVGLVFGALAILDVLVR